jgi:hypothetical protein
MDPVIGPIVEYLEREKAKNQYPIRIVKIERPTTRSVENIEIVKEFKDYEDLKNNILPLEIERSFLNRTHIAEKDYSYCHALEYEYGKFRLANQGKDPEEILDNISKTIGFPTADNFIVIKGNTCNVLELLWKISNGYTHGKKRSAYQNN